MKEYLTYENKILRQEIERLAKEVEKLEKVNKMLLNSMVTEAHTKETKEIERLNNIINKFERWLDKKEKLTFNSWNKGIHEVQRKLQELKGDGGNE